VDLGVAATTEAHAWGDADGVRTLLANLVDNAIRYTPPGGRVDVAIRTQGAHVILEVADTGPGIPADERQRVFDRFYRVPGAGGSGSGLGLAIVKAIAERSWASVTLEDTPGGGLTARVAFVRTPRPQVGEAPGAGGPPERNAAP
jgi:two-component system OmpR family sensor kinase